jgi:hypothetical protein
MEMPMHLLFSGSRLLKGCRPCLPDYQVMLDRVNLLHGIAIQEML